MSSNQLPPELRNLKFAQGPIMLIGLIIAGLSLAANIAYWTQGLTGQSYWINFVFAGMVEIVFVFLIWLGGNIWKSGGRALASALFILTFAPWLASSISNFMFLATINDPAMTSADADLAKTKIATLKSDLSRYQSELGQYSHIQRKDVDALKDQQAYCDKVAKDECSSSDVAGQIATNLKINELEAKQSATLEALELITNEHKQAIQASAFSIQLLSEKLDGNLLSREFLMVAFLDVLKVILFFVGIWINLRLHVARAVAVERQIDVLEQIEARHKALEARERAFDEKLRAAAPAAPKPRAKRTRATDQKKPEKMSEPAAIATEPKDPPKPDTQPKTRPEKAASQAANIIQYPEKLADGTTIIKTKSIA